MSIWHTITDKEDIYISDDKKTVNILYESDYNGNNYVEIPIEFLIEKLKPLITDK